MRIYVACPMPTYHTPLYDANLARIAAACPGDELVEVRNLYRNGRHFVATYKGHVGSCDSLIYFADAYQIVGRGVFDEVRYAMGQGLSVNYLDGDKDKKYRLAMLGNDDWVNYAHVVEADWDDPDGHPGAGW
jgi:hypothetical protein